METENFKEAGEIFQNAIEIEDPAKRIKYIENACEGNGKLRKEVETLLKAHGKAGDYLETPATDKNITLNGPLQIEGPGTKIGRYKLLELIGEGGMGLVYLAEQSEPVKRRVALKVIKPGMDSKEVVARFESERQALALLDHPNIAHVFDAGTTDSGRPYFVMEYVKGMSITRYCDEHKLNIEQRLRLFGEVCEGVHYAHQKGIIHRDIKPSNILVSMHGDRAVPKIIDFGIAKAAVSALTEKTIFTFHGQLLGTPEYMSPEQVDLATQDIDTRSDIYSLGVVLYELLTGVLPFEIEPLQKIGLAELQHTIRELEPASPSIRLSSLGQKAKVIADNRMTQVIPLARRLHRELEWIPLKAMRKDRCRRYKSASDMAEDIQRYLNGNPLLAGPETAMYRVQKFVHKHAGSVATAALLLVVIVIGLVASILMGCRAEHARKQEAVARTEAEQARDQEIALRQQLEQALVRAEQAEEATNQKIEELQGWFYGRNIQQADTEYRGDNISDVRKLLESCPEDLRGWEWDYLNHISDQFVTTIAGADWPDVALQSAALSPDGQFIVSNGGGSTVKVWNAEDGTELNTLSGHEDTVTCVTLSPDGRHIASGSMDSTVRLWDVETGVEVATLRGHTGQIWNVRYSPDGTRIASSEFYDVIKIWDCATGEEMVTIQQERTHPGGLTFSPDGRYIASGGNGDIHIWDANSGEEMMTIPSAHLNQVTNVAYSPDGKHIVSCGAWGQWRIRIWDAATGEEVMSVQTPGRSLGYVDYDRSGRYIISDNVNSFNIWDAATGENVLTLSRPQRHILSAIFSPDDSRIISSADDKTLEIWNISSSMEQFLIPTPSNVGLIWFSPDGRHLATAATSQEPLILWDAMTGVELRHLSGQTKRVYNCAFSPDGKRIVLAEAHPNVRVWDVETGKQLTVFHRHDGQVISVAYSPDGRSIASASLGTIEIWDATTGAELMKLEDENSSEIVSLTYSPDGSRLISYRPSFGGNGTIEVWDVESGERLLVIEKEGQAGYGYVRVSRDGKLIALNIAQDSTVPIWDATNGRELMTLSGHNGPVEAISFSPIADRLVSCSDGTIKVWDTTTGLELMTLGENLHGAAFSPDGSTIATNSWEGIVLFETKEPAAGLGPRRSAQAVRQLVQRLHEEYGTYPQVMDQLSTDDTLDDSVRETALQIVDCRIPQESSGFARNVWLTIIPIEEDPQVYETLRVGLEEANRLVPDNTFILEALGAVQCRLGAYQDALESLTKCMQIASEFNNIRLEPAVMGFQAMALYGTGQVEEAKAALAQLRQQMGRMRMRGGGGRIGRLFQDIMSELEGLIEDTEEP